MNKAYKFRIYPTIEQQALLARTFGCVRFIYNKMLSDKISHYNNTGKSLYCYPSQYKSEYPWLKEVDSLALVGAYNNLKCAYNNFFKNKKFNFPKFKSRKSNYASYTTNCINGNIKIEDGYITLPKLKAVKINLHRNIPKDYILKSVTVSKSPTGKYFASILYEYEHKIDQVIPRRFLGLDFSMTELYVDSEGRTAKYPRYYRRSLEKLKKESRKLSLCTRGSKNYFKQRLKLARLYEKITNEKKDFLHKLSRKITNSYDAICIESLNMQAMSQALHFGKSVSDNSWGTFVNMLKYKLQEQGKKLIQVDKWYPSSKKCSACGRKKEKEELKLSDRIYKCHVCGNVIDRDINAAINIKKEGIRMVYA